ncbi:glycosyltransferase [Fibrella forsythiae]|uniref:Glycosyltransferase n=1 Tax=Fibrella forsythiae TaxID=2817061 RepID=A0ABS3JS84_9BACT|nr:glycosyltransferase [Fibrella forsythiae]MBO0952318.1 glycosyltransferase [Fibrella forsythiae]
MHIFYPIGTFYPAQSGGPSNSVYWLARAMVRQGVQVTVISTDTDQPAETIRDQWIDTEAGQVRYVTTRNHNVPWRHSWWSFKRLITSDIVHLTSLFYPLSLVVGFLAILRGQIVVWSPRGELAPNALENGSALKKTVLNWFRWKAKAITFHTTSPDETKQVKHQFGSSVRVIELPNYIELPPQFPRSDQQRVPYLLFLGRLHPIKALDRLLEALARSSAFREGNWQLKLVGSDADGYGDLLRQQASLLDLTDRVTFEPPVSGRAKQQLLADAYALVLPSHSENFGNVVVEALAQGTPVIASTGTPWACLVSEHAGFWISNNPEDLTVSITTCLSLSADSYNLYRQRAAELAQHQFDSKANSYRWLAAYYTLYSSNLTPSVCAE